MLGKVLRLIAAAGVADSAELARRMGVSYMLMQGMLETLAGEGYLKPVAARPSAACSHCPMRRGCLIDGKTRLWALSGKGKRVLARQA
jgi:hypothetical protein